MLWVLEELTNKISVELQRLQEVNIFIIDLFLICFESNAAVVVTTLATPEGEEVFDASNLGECEEVYEEAVGDNDCVFFKGMKRSNCASIVIRGANEFMCEEVDR